MLLVSSAWDCGHRWLMLALLGVCAGLGTVFGPQEGRAQEVQAPVAIGESQVRTLSRFGDARSVAVDPEGQLYVADAQTSTVTVLTARGSVATTLGGAGTQPGQLDGPSDVDPTNGLSLWIADTGNGRLQHVSRDLKFLESLPVGRVDPSSGPQSRQPVFDVGRDGNDVRAEGEPVSVASTSANEVFAVDARQSVVVKWDAQRRPERVIGGFEQHSGRLRQPVALAVTATHLYVADPARSAVLVYDLFGTYVRTITAPAPDADLSATRALTVVNGFLWIVTPTHVYVTTPEGRPKTTIPVSLDAPLVDVSVRPNRLYLLTKTRLLEVTR